MHNNDYSAFTDKTTRTTGLVLDIELQGSKQVTVNRKLWDAADPVYVKSQGNYQTLGNGHVLLGHGVTPEIKEYDENGAVVMSARFGYDNTMGSYRSYRAPWVGRPSTKPDVVACPPPPSLSSSLPGESGVVAVYVSWNGATDVDSWRVYSGSQVKKTAVRNGFETRILVDGLDSGESVVVEAVGGVGDGTRSRAVTVKQDC